MSQRIVSRCLKLGITLVLASGWAHAQSNPTAPSIADMYCSGVFTTDPVPHDIFLIAPEESGHRIGAETPDLVHINKGSADGVKVGDEFLVSRPMHDPVGISWFKWQPGILRAMGPAYEDVGRLRVVNVQEKTATAQVVYSCDYMQRDDVVQPFVERPSPAFHDASQFDIFAPPSGKPVAMIAAIQFFGQVAGQGMTVYINLGSKQGVNVGDYFRVFRYQGANSDTVYTHRGTNYTIYGFGSDKVHYAWKDLPREILGEGIVVRVGPNAATVILTHSRREIFTGDYAEVE
jgi:hypothetical protein